MTPEQLKASILQYAIQGKLVEQRAEEESAEELYKQIQEEKQKLIREGKIKKEKTLAEITEDEIPFDIPDSWKWVKLGDCTSYAQSKEKISPPEITNDMWSLDLEDIQKETGTILVKTLASERKISGDKVKFRKGQVLYSKLRPYLKKILVAPDDGICTPELVPFNVYGIDANYISYVLKSPHVDYIINTATYGVKMPRVGTDTMINLLIPLPPLEEQSRIVTKIEEMLPFVDRYAASYEKLEQFNAKFPEDMKKSILQYAIQGKLVEQRAEEGSAEELYKQIQEEKQKLIKEGKIKKEKPLADITEDEIPFEIPDSWKWVRFGECINLLSGQDLTSDRYNDKNEGIVYLTGASNIDDSENVIINRWTTSPTSVAKKGDLLITCKGTIGKTAILNIEEAHIARQIMAISEICLDINFVKYFLKISVDMLQRKAKSMIPGIDRDTVRNLALPLPPLEEQKRIVAKIEELLPYCNQLMEKY